MSSPSYQKDKVVRIINSVIEKVSLSKEQEHVAVYHQLKELQAIIEQARSEIGLARPADIKDKHIPTATDELDAIIEATATATGSIMDACEAIEEKAATMPGDCADQVSAEVTKIYEACSFQDITGQRITKVVSTLKTIEEKVDSLIRILGDDHHGGATSHGGGDDGDQREGDAALLNGPQLAGQGVSQEEIDRLLSEFD
ncbi:MAG: protein phosphatase CheZ [Alphaproteobacteria bacterium]|nr:protein phosphatase CheZ [Alphaproteobacteria bacterium]MCD8570271.1 protein phosphatase CheZ [Alphaproteobacteria bacterium]